MRLPTTLGVLLLAAALSLPAIAQRDRVIIVVGEQGPNSLDTQTPTANNLTRMVAWNVYDRLVTHGTRVLDNGAIVYDPDNIEPELAESWEISEDGTVMTFTLREDAVFHDGSPVTAHDVKWSFDRAVAAGGFPAIQMAAGSFTDPEQFQALDDRTFQITLPRPSKLALPNLAVPIPIVLNADLVKQHATEDDPWGREWLQNNDAGSGAFTVERFTPGSELVLQRFEDWAAGPLPEVERVIYREIPSPGTRRALLERGDADISIGLPPKDYAELDAQDQVEVIAVPIQSALYFIDMNTQMPPFDDPKVRQAIAYATPYNAIMESALYNRAVPMYGAEPGTEVEPDWPVPSPFHTDMDRARALLEEAGVDGFETEIYFDQSRSTVFEPMAVLLQENLAELGIQATINKVPGSNWFARMSEKDMPIVISSFYAWLDWPEYHLFWTYHGGNNSVFNTANYVSEELDALIDEARYMEDATPEYEDRIRAMIEIVMTDVPRIPLARYFLDSAVQPNVEGYTYWFHTLPDFRPLRRN